MRGAVLQLKGDVMDSGFRNVDDVDDVVITIAGKKGRYALKLVGVPESEEFFVELSELCCMRADHRYVAQAQWRYADVLEARRRCFDVAVELDGVPVGDFHLDQL